MPACRGRFLVYPHCLRFLDLLQSTEVRTILINDRAYAVTLGDQQFYHWLYRRRHTHNPYSAPEPQQAQGV